MHSKNGYLLRLDNDLSWHLSSQDEMSWLDSLAKIMELAPGRANGRFKIYYSKSSKSLHEKNWKVHDLKYLKIWSHQDKTETICEVGVDDKVAPDFVRMILTLLPIYKRLIEYGGLPFHSALIKKNNAGFLLAAQGGTGKSTCCRRLPKPWTAICDDETLIVPDRNKKYSAHPMPTWSDYMFKRAEKTWKVEESFPLRGIFFLKRADTDKAIPLGAGKAAALIFESAIQAYQRYLRNLDKSEMANMKNKIFNNACKIAASIPSFVLEVSLTGCFWQEIERVI